MAQPPCLLPTLSSSASPDPAPESSQSLLPTALTVSRLDHTSQGRHPSSLLAADAPDVLPPCGQPGNLTVSDHCGPWWSLADSV